MLRWMRAIRLIAHIAIALFLMVITGALWNPHSRLVKRCKRWWLNKATRIMGVHIRVHGQIPDQKGVLLASNHVSWFDIPLLGGLTQLNFLSKAEVRDWPLIGKLAESTGTLFIRRGAGDANRVADQISDYLEAGRSVLFFPEGTTSSGEDVGRFHPKLFRSALRHSAQVCPVALSYFVPGHDGNPIAFIGDDEFTQHLWKLLQYPRIEANVSFLPLRPISECPHEPSLQQQVRDIREQIRSEVKLLQLNTSTRWPGASIPDDPADEAASY